MCIRDSPPAPGAEPVDPNLEDAYLYYMMSIGQEMSLEAEVGEGVVP